MSPPALTSAGEEAEDARGVDLAGLGVTGVHHRLILVSSEPEMTRVGLDGVDRPRDKSRHKANRRGRRILQFRGRPSGLEPLTPGATGWAGHVGKNGTSAARLRNVR